jgi:hypothetical protein
MRLAAISGVLALCFVGAALAQTDLVPAESFAPEFEALPEGRHYASLYPRSAIGNDVHGLAVMCCRPRADRTLECVHAIEWPAGYGFGAASQQIVRRFRMTPESYEAFNANPHNWIRRTIVWRVGGRNATELERVRRVVEEEGAGLCRPDPVYADEPVAEAAPQQ